MLQPGKEIPSGNQWIGKHSRYLNSYRIRRGSSGHGFDSGIGQEAMVLVLELVQRPELNLPEEFGPEAMEMNFLEEFGTEARVLDF